MKIERLCIVGPGRLGASLAAGMVAVPALQVACFVHPRPASVRPQLPPALQTIPIYESVALAIDSAEFDSILLCVGDRRLPDLVLELTELGAALQGRLIIHCTGSLGREVLQPLARECAARTAAAHPFQTFADRDSAAVLRGSAWGVEAQAADHQDLADWIGNMGGEAVFLDKVSAQSKALYHAAAVAASNALIANVELARALAEAAGIPSAKFLAPIMRQSLNNALDALELEHGPIDVLTGPIIRGDLETVRRHLSALDGQPALRRAYVAAMRMTAATCVAQTAISPADFDAIQRTLRAFDDE